MSLQVEKLEKNMAKLTIEVPAEEFEKAIQGAYMKNRGKMNIPGFRKGKAPRKMLEQMYGKGVFYEDAANAMIPEAYEKELVGCDLYIVSQPEIDVTQLESGKPFIFTALVALKPEVSLGKYKNVKIDKIDVAVTEEEVLAEIDKEREKSARIITVDDRAVKDGDMTVIDFKGFLGEEAFEGGSGEDYPLTIGSGSFIPGFEEQLIGANLGEDKEVKVTFPEDYQAEELKGKEATFQCVVKEIKEKELPELTDEFAGEVSEFDTLEEYKADVRKTLEEGRTEEAKGQKEDAIINAIIEDAHMEIPDAMIAMQQNQMVRDFTQRIQQQGLTLEQYYQFTGMNPETLMEQTKPQATKRIQSRLVLEAVAAAEKLDASDEELEKELEKMAESYKMELDKVKNLLGESEMKQIKEDIAVQKAVTFVVEAAKEQ